MQTDPDLMIWIKAAIPPKPNGRVDRARAADRLGISERTLRRWLAEPDRVPQAAIKRLHQLAILRGKGTILWPAPPQDVLERDATLAEYASRAVGDIAQGVSIDFWTGPEPDRMKPHSLYVLHFPRAHVYATSIAQHAKALARIKRAGAVVVEQRDFATYWAAQSVKMHLLLQHRERRCVVPKSLVPVNRTHLWREEE